MNRRQFLSSLGVGAIGLYNTGGLIRGKIDSDRRSHPRSVQDATTTAAVTTQDFTTRTVEPIDVVSNVTEESFEITYGNAEEYDASLDDIDVGLNDTAWFIEGFLNDRTSMENNTVLENKYIGRLQHWSFRRRDNPLQVAQVTAAGAGAIAQGQDPFDILDVNIVLESEEAEEWAEHPVNQSYQIRGDWVQEYLADERDTTELLQDVLGTGETHRTTTATTTTTTTSTTESQPPDDSDEWTFTNEVQSDGTLDLIEDGLEGGYTLWGEYDRYSTHLYGVVENISDATLSYAEVEANFYVNNAVVAEGRANMTNLPPGRRWRFDAMAAESVQFDHVDVYLSGRA